MCGRYILAEAAAAERAMRIQRSGWTYAVSYRVLPTQPVPVVVLTEGERAAVMMRWGLIPYWAQGEQPKLSTFNATAERMDSAPTFRGAWQRDQRCLVVMGGFYEPHVNPDATRDPYFLRLADRDIFAVAGLWERSFRTDGEAVYSCTLITVPANPLLAQVHNAKQRMPAILREADHEAWLRGSKEAACATLEPYPAELMLAWKVGRQVNLPKGRDDASLIAPVETNELV